jgi:hypothetical protein
MARWHGSVSYGARQATVPRAPSPWALLQSASPGARWTTNSFRSSASAHGSCSDRYARIKVPAQVSVEAGLARLRPRLERLRNDPAEQRRIDELLAEIPPPESFVRTPPAKEPLIELSPRPGKGVLDTPLVHLPSKDEQDQDHGHEPDQGQGRIRGQGKARDLIVRGAMLGPHRLPVKKTRRGWRGPTVILRPSGDSTESPKEPYEVKQFSDLAGFIRRHNLPVALLVVGAFAVA